MAVTPQDIVACARTWLGTRYHHQGRLKKNATSRGGVDCIGLVVGVVRELDIKDETGYSVLPQGYAFQEAIQQHCTEIAITEIQPGDLLLFRFETYPQHIAIVSDYQDGLGIIHCHSRSRQVVEHALTAQWRSMITNAYRFKHLS